MLSSFAAMFCVSHTDVESVADLMRHDQRSHESWVTSKHQRRWLVMGQALLAWKQTARTSALTKNAELWDMLHAKCSLVEHFLAGTDAKAPNSGNALDQYDTRCICTLMLTTQLSQDKIHSFWLCCANGLQQCVNIVHAYVFDSMTACICGTDDGLHDHSLLE